MMPDKGGIAVKNEETALSSPSVSLGNSLLLSLSDGSTPTGSSSFKDPDSPSATKQAKKPRRKWKKPEGKPKRPLSAYNLYFQAERRRMVRRGIKKKLGFRDMAKIIGAKWNTLGPRARVSYEKNATEERKKYFAALADWKREQRQQAEKEQNSFERQMELFGETIPESLHTLDIQEPLPIVDQATPTKDLNETNVFSTSMSAMDFDKGNNNTDLLQSTLQMASDLTSDTLNQLESTLEAGSFCPDDSSLQSPAMQRILNSFRGLDSSMDEEFLDFMSTLDFNGIPVAKNQQGRRS